MTLVILTTFLALVLAPGGQAGPTGIRPRDNPADNCVSKCRGQWGWPGYPFSNDPWGSVVDPKLSTSDVGSGSGVGGVEAAPSSDSGSSLVTTGLITSTVSGYYASAPNAPAITSSSPSYSTSSSSSTYSFPTSSSSKASSSSFSSSSSSSTPPPPPPTSSSTPPPAPSSSSFTPPPPPPPSPSPSSSPAPAPSSSASDSNSSAGSNSGSGSTGGPTSQSDIQAYLDGHNSIRSQHGAEPLTYSQDLASKAQQWANGCVFKHSGGTLGPLGENIAAGTGDGYGIPQALKSWTDESSQYDASNPQPSHFTQVVWKGTSQVGCALQMCDGIFPGTSGKAAFYVCEYSAQGNVIGDFAQNVQA